MRAILVANVKGGCGKTTVATHLAAAFAAGGLNTVLADADRQRSSLLWCEMRPGHAAPIAPLDWSRRHRDVPAATERLVIDGPAGFGREEREALIRRADLVAVPLLPSVFDEGATAGFVRRVERIKAVRKGRKPLAIVANRLRPATRAARRLEAFVAELGHRPAGRIPERAIYGELACEGLALFDIATRPARANALHWLPLLEHIETTLRSAG